MIEQIVGKSADILRFFFSLEFLYSPIYLFSTIFIAFIFWKICVKNSDFVKFLFPRELYSHPSTLVDLKVAVFNLLFQATGALSVVYVAPVITFRLLSLLSGFAGGVPTENTTWLTGVAAVVILFLTQDLCRYLNHSLHHRHRILWPFHAVHHSAEVLTPITYMRAHPVYHMVQILVISVLVGSVQAIMLFVFLGQLEFWVIYSVSLAFYAYMILGGHLRHSHILLRYGRVLEHILISPAQHQVHHSCDPKHFNKNFGEIFAIWDWLFGTLYIPERDEELVYGIADKNGRIVQPHTTLRAAMMQPFFDSARAIRATFSSSARSDINAGRIKDEQ